MVSHLSKDDVTLFLTHILTPVYRIIEDDTIRDPQMGTFMVFIFLNESL